MSHKAEILGPFQFLVLCYVEKLDSYAYGLRILDELDTQLEKRVNVGQVYNALSRLTKEGLLKFESKVTTRGKRSSQIYLLTPKGRQAMQETIAFWDDAIKLQIQQ